MKTLMVLAALSGFSLTTAAASACDGMRDHDKSSDTQAKNENGKSAGKAKSKTDAAKPGTQDNGSSKS